MASAVEGRHMGDSQQLGTGIIMPAKNNSKLREAYLLLTSEEKHELADAVGISYKKLSLLMSMDNSGRNPIRIEYVIPMLNYLCDYHITMQDVIHHAKVRGL